MAIVTIPKGSVNWDVPVNENFNDLDARMPGKKNLLDNWYFADPVNQRGGYVVPPDTAYYSDTALTTQAGTVSAYTTANYVNTTYGSITVSGTTYYVAYADMVRGYTGAGYGIDRWMQNNYGSALLTDDGIILTATGTFTFDQIVDNQATFYGKQITASCLLRDGTLVTGTGIIPNSATAGWIIRKEIGSTAALMSFGMDSNTTMRFRINFSTAGNITIIAAKLELGDKQTLAHQDANGNWVLNDPPPNKQQELAKCEKYFEVIEHTLCEAVSTTRLQGIRYRTRKRAVPNITFFPYKSASPFYDASESGYVSKQSDGSKVAVTGVTLSTEDGFGQVSGTFVKGDYYYVSAYVDANL